MAKAKSRTRSRKTPPSATKESAGAFRRICNVVPSKGTDRDWKYEDALSAGALGAVAALPPSVDLRAPWWAIESLKANVVEA